MKPSRIVLGMAVLLLLASAVRANDEPPKAHRALSFIACGTIIADTFLTYDWIYRCHGEEGNPFWKPIIRKPAIVLTLDLGTCFGITEGSRAAWKKNKLLGWLIPAAVVIVQSYTLYDHYQIRRKGE